MYRLEMFDPERGVKVAGHRGFFLTGEGVDLNQAMINYGLDFLKSKGFKKMMTPFFMRKELMSKTAQLEEFDEALYGLRPEAKAVGEDGQPVPGGGDDDKYLIATSEQPISAFHSDEWFDSPKEQLPIKYAGYSTCFRKEAGSYGRDMWGIFRVHQFEKVEQFCITDPDSSWEMLDTMLANSEEFYQSLGLAYRVVAIVSGALNNAAAMKYDLEAWFPFQGEHKELVSCSNCTDYQARELEVRCGTKRADSAKKVYCHMLKWVCPYTYIRCDPALTFSFSLTAAHSAPRSARCAAWWRTGRRPRVCASRHRCRSTWAAATSSLTRGSCRPRSRRRRSEDFVLCRSGR